MEPGFKQGSTFKFLRSVNIAILIINFLFIWGSSQKYGIFMDILPYHLVFILPSALYHMLGSKDEVSSHPRVRKILSRLGSVFHLFLILAFVINYVKLANSTEENEIYLLWAIMFFLSFPAAIISVSFLLMVLLPSEPKRLILVTTNHCQMDRPLIYSSTPKPLTLPYQHLSP
ncbi:unnamed protein product [Moneuplotes crassus]|uniref:Transmembrane protein n=1 Tax=Euplotes crassus TaxID=5936 RepID=A0AAD2D6P2_EUPCR|nr:unnamed protein product [Moneuplotes crassus]